MDMLSGKQITAAELTDWRKLGQGLHARFVVADFRAAVRFLAAVSEIDPAVGDHLEARTGTGHVDLKLISRNAIYRDDASKRPTSIRRHGSDSTSMSKCPTTSPNSASRPRSKPAP
jgi:pterin-4a-carbinolamine dehydratase